MTFMGSNYVYRISVPLILSNDEGVCCTGVLKLCHPRARILIIQGFGKCVNDSLEVLVDDVCSCVLQQLFTNEYGKAQRLPTNVYGYVCVIAPMIELRCSLAIILIIRIEHST